MKPSLLRLSAIGVLLLAGCNSNSTIKLSNIDQAYADAICHMYATCTQVNGQGGGGVDSTLIRLLAQNPGTATCSDLVMQNGGADLGAYQASVDAGRIKYDGSAAKTCLNALTSSCMAFDSSRASAVSSACDRVWQGQVAAGGVCTMDADCANSGQCEKNGGCTGTCVAVTLKPVGSSCNSSDECDQNVPNGYAVCRPTTTNPQDHCVAVTLTTGAAGGEGCGMVVSTGDTWEYATCSKNLYCRYTSGGGGGGTAVGVCAAPIAQGGACVPQVDICANDLACARNPGGASGYSCQAITLVSTAGQACNQDALIFCNPLDRLDCQNDVCVLVGTGVVGQPCRSDWGTDCNVGLYCDPTLGGNYDGLCAAKLADGSPCNPGLAEACQSGYCDDRTNPLAPVCSTVMCGG